MKHIGTAVILSGPSGVGKSTVCSHLFKARPGIGFSVSCTTRSPRPGEVDGVAYHFLNKDEFQSKIEANAFLEWAEVHGNYYGTLKEEVKPIVMAGRDVILDIDVQGCRLVKTSCENDPVLRCSIISVFLVPPSLEVLERRLRGRGTETEEAILRRLGNARREMEAWREYDYVIVNDEAEEAARRLEAIIESSHLRTTVMDEEPWIK